jgi:hypothetical protein
MTHFKSPDCKPFKKKEIWNEEVQIWITDFIENTYRLQMETIIFSHITIEVLLCISSSFLLVAIFAVLIHVRNY